MTKLHSPFVLGLTALALACSGGGSGGDANGTGGTTSSTGGGPPMSGGATGIGGAPPTGGFVATGGVVSTGGDATTATGGAMPTGGASTGGSPASGGSSGSGGAGGSVGGSGQTAGGGAATGGGGGGAGGAGVSGAGGGGASGGGATTGGNGAGGSSDAAMPSPGCGKAGRPSNGQVEVANTSLYMFPPSYDGTTPFPLLIALHACGNPNTEFVSLTNNTGFATDYVRSFPNTPDSGQCWSNYNGDISRIISQYDELMNNYCIDQNHVFSIGHSSGAQMLVNILSHKSDADHLNLKGVSPVAADPYNVADPMPVLYIDGEMDNQRSANSARDTVARFRTANGCEDTSQSYTSVMECNSTDSGRPLVDPGCIIYDGCAVPTIWCSHNDPSYSGTQHGVPCFAMQAMDDFFAGLW